MGPGTLGGARGEGGLQATRPHSREEGAECAHGHMRAAVQMADGSEPAKPLQGAGSVGAGGHWGQGAAGLLG